MTPRRAEISASLAEQGRPKMWATEQEAAVLSGVGPERFRCKVSGWEKRGFPQINPENGKRSIPAILAFWGLPANHSAPPLANPAQADEDDDGQENFHGHGQGQRRAS